MEKMTVRSVQMLIDNMRKAGAVVEDAYVALGEAKIRVADAEIDMKDAEIEIVKLFAQEGRWYDLALTPATRKAIMKD